MARAALRFTPRPVTVLCEDQRGPQKEFGLQRLVNACAFDMVDGERHLVERALGDWRPLKSDTKLLRACREELDLIAADGRHVAAIFDDDRVRRLLKLPASASAERVKARIKDGCATPERLHVFLLERNLESVLLAAARCDPTLDHDLLERATRHKEHIARDAILLELAMARQRLVRACILKEMASLRELVAALCALVGATRGARTTAPRR